jgi:LssY C-terminus
MKPCLRAWILASKKWRRNAGSRSTTGRGSGSFDCAGQSAALPDPCAEAAPTIRHHCAHAHRQPGAGRGSIRRCRLDPGFQGGREIQVRDDARRRRGQRLQRSAGLDSVSGLASAAAHDTGIDFSAKDRTFVYKIDSQIDIERAKVVNDLLLTGKVQSLLMGDRPNVPRNGGTRRATI